MDPTYNYTSDGPIFLSIGNSIFNFLNCLINQYPYEIFVESMQYGRYWLMGVMHWLIGEFWVVGSILFYTYKLLSEPNVRSVWQIIINSEGASKQPKRVKRHVYRRYNIKGRIFLPRLPLKLFVHSCYQSTGAYTYHDIDINLDELYSIASSSSTSAELANQTSKVSYTFVSKWVKKPPQNGYWTSLIVLLLCMIIYSSLISQCAFNIIKQLNKRGSMSNSNQTVLTTTESGSCASLLFESDGTTFFVDNAANTSV